MEFQEVICNLTKEVTDLKMKLALKELCGQCDSCDELRQVRLTLAYCRQTRLKTVLKIREKANETQHLLASVNKYLLERGSSVMFLKNGQTVSVKTNN